MDYNINDIENRLAEMRALNKALADKQNELFKYQNNGIEAEKSGDVKGAINSYVQAIEYAKATPEIHANNYYYSIQRLAILYRRGKEYVNEISLISYAMTIGLNEKDRSDMSARLEKAKALLAKNQE